jgi:putative (di)nucleoside polyphosphate hydrolase
MKNMPYYFEKGWRIGVGICLLNKNKHIFLGERIDNKGAWQMPQGGVNITNNENLLTAAKRELFEETGVKNIKLLKESKVWYYYQLPDYLKKKLWSGKFKGQKQKWFAFSLTGKEDEINLNANNKPEFTNWKWVKPENTEKEIVSFKQDIYRKILLEFHSLF